MQRTWINELTDQTNVGLGGTHGSATQIYDVSLGNNGIIPLIGVQGEDGTTFANYLSMNPYVKKNLIAVPIDYPKGLDYMPNAAWWIRAYIAIMSTLPTSITGVDSTVTTQTDETAFDNSGNMLTSITGVKGSAVNISLSIKERYGKTLVKVMTAIIEHLYGDRYSQIPKVSPYIPEGERLAWGPRYQCGTTLYFELDPLGREVADAMIVFNQSFDQAGTRQMAKEVGGNMGGVELSYSIPGIGYNGPGAFELAAKVVKRQQLWRQNGDIIKLPTEDVDNTIREIRSPGLVA
jgi:hypothetical protein